MAVGNGVAPNGDTFPNLSVTASSKKLRETERRRRRRKQKKNKKESEVDVEEGNVTGASDSKENDDPPKQVSEEVVVEYVAEQPEFEEGFEDAFRKIFDKFNFRESVASEVRHGKKEEPEEKADVKKKLNSDSDSEAEEHDNEQKENGISNKKKKLQRRMNIAELKQVSARPDVVEAYIEKEDGKKLKQKQRERMQPKMGKMNIDYQVLHDAFFKYQTKPKLTSLGELYFEGKEFEVKLREMKPGTLSHDLKEALGMSEGAPPPWLINMQRYGPPPSYPHLKIPGLNAPIPLGAIFGFHAGGWGKPPVDENGRPLYGVQQQDQPTYEDEPIDKSKHWGDLEEEEEEEEEAEQEEEMDEEGMEDGIESVDTLSSTPTGIETPDAIELRKEQRKEPDRPLYQVLEEKSENVAPGTILRTSRTYIINTGSQDKAGAKRVDLLPRGQKTDRVDVSLQPEELDALDNVLPAKYEEAREKEKKRSQREDFSDMVAENEKKRKGSGKCMIKTGRRRRISNFEKQEMVSFNCIEFDFRLPMYLDKLSIA